MKYTGCPILIVHPDLTSQKMIGWKNVLDSVYYNKEILINYVEKNVYSKLYLNIFFLMYLVY